MAMKSGLTAALTAVGVTAVVLTSFAIVRLAGPAPAPPQRPAAATADPGGVAYQRESIRMVTWNICGEAGSSRGVNGYCAWRARPQAKVAAIETIVRARDLNVVMVQEACYPDPAPARAGSNNHVELLMAALGPEWTYRTAEVPRAGTGSRCRAGLNGTIGNAIAVRGKITSATVTPLLVAGDPAYYPDPTTDRTSSLLCVRVEDWQSTPCVTHLLHTSDPEYLRETASLKQKVAGVTWPVLGGDFNTSQGANPTSPLKPMFDAYPECDQQAYLPGDTVNETTHYTPGTTETPTVTATKLDYIFATAGFVGCDSLVELADNTVNTAGADEPTGLSDHAPVVGVTRGQAVTWPFNETSGSTTADASGNNLTGTLAGGVTRSPARAHSLAFDGTGTVTGVKDTLNLFDARHSFTVAAWANPATGAPTGSLLSQAGNAATLLNLSYSAGQWRFGLAAADTADAAIDQVSAPATTGKWTHLVAGYDAVTGKMSLFVNGTLAGTATHTKRQPTGVPAVVGAKWVGGIDDVRLYPYALTTTEIGKLRTDETMKPAVPTGTTTIPAGTGGDPGCHQNGGYGTVASLTPRLTAHVSHDDPTVPVRGEFSIWDNTDPSQPQPIYLGGAGSASDYVTGGGTVSVQVPTLLSGHSYGWYVRAGDGTITSTTAPVCHFEAGGS